MNYRVLAAARQDMNEGWIWLSEPAFPQRAVIRVENQANGKAIYCEVLQIDDNFRTEYNKPPRTSIPEAMPVVVMNAWYRHLLGDLETRHNYELGLTAANTPYAKLRVCFQHPQVMVRVAMWLACISVSLGVLGVFLALI